MFWQNSGAGGVRTLSVLLSARPACTFPVSASCLSAGAGNFSLRLTGRFPPAAFLGRGGCRLLRAVHFLLLVTCASVSAYLSLPLTFCFKFSSCFPCDVSVVQCGGAAYVAVFCGSRFLQSTACVFVSGLHPCGNPWDSMSVCLFCQQAMSLTTMMAMCPVCRSV